LRFDVLSQRVEGQTILSVIWQKERVVTQPGPEPISERPAAPEESAAWADAVGRLGTDWWATIVAGVITVLAVANLLPKIPW
jgi:hypothetical protein